LTQFQNTSYEFQIDGYYLLKKENNSSKFIFQSSIWLWINYERLSDFKVYFIK